VRGEGGDARTHVPSVRGPHRRAGAGSARRYGHRPASERLDTRARPHGHNRRPAALVPRSHGHRHGHSTPTLPAGGPLTISTNRPSFTDTAGIVPIGHFQLETGYTFTYRDRDGVETQTHNAPELLARVPVLEDRLELQFGTYGYVWSRSDDGSGFDANQGFSDATVGLRL
jgi:hypothetical protein